MIGTAAMQIGCFLPLFGPSDIGREAVNGWLAPVTVRRRNGAFDPLLPLATDRYREAQFSLLT
jgi:hypothetical protein